MKLKFSENWQAISMKMNVWIEGKDNNLPIEIKIGKLKTSTYVKEVSTEINDQNFPISMHETNFG